jgi:thiamine-monophosphate kinase
MNSLQGRTLAEIGELRLLEEVVLPMARAFDQSTLAGDDCAFIPVGEHMLAATGDVGPRPVIQNLAAHREDWEAAGWLAVVATASDVASAAAKPLFLTNCIDAPPDLRVEALTSFMQGYFRALTSFGFRNGGGDLRHGPNLLARVFGVGLVEHGKRIGRSGAAAGDHLVAIGPAGSFMANFLLAMKAEETTSRTLTPEDSPESLRFPRPQLEAMQILARHGLIVAASDTSDGLIGAMDNIARSSHCGFHLQLDEAHLAPEIWAAAEQYGANSPWNIFFAWGDWSIAAVIPAGRLDEFEAVCQSHRFESRVLGEATVGDSLTAQTQGTDTQFEVTTIRNENFLLYGFNAGLSGHLDYILRTPLLTSIARHVR